MFRLLTCLALTTGAFLAAPTPAKPPPQTYCLIDTVASSCFEDPTDSNYWLVYACATAKTQYTLGVIELRVWDENDDTWRNAVRSNDPTQTSYVLYDTDGTKNFWFKYRIPKQSVWGVAIGNGECPCGVWCRSLDTESQCTDYQYAAIILE